jgi:twitching motility protein PilT
MEETRLGTILLESGIIAEGDLEKCLQLQALTGGSRPLGQILVEQNIIDHGTLERLLRLQDALQRERRLARDTSNGEAGFLKTAVQLGASELIVSEGRPPAVRIAGEWRSLASEPLDGPEVWDFVREEMGSEVLEDLAERRYVSRDLHRPGVCRGRITAFRQFDGVAVMVRLHPALARTPAEAGMPDAAVAEQGGGLTEAFASLLHQAARQPERYILVLDDNLEYGLPDGPALVVRRRVGEHATDYPTALRTALREDPDVLFVGDIGQPESFDLALRAAEGGRLVVACLRAASVVGALQRALNFYPGYDVPRIRTTLASVLQCVVAKHLLPDADRKGLVPAAELLLVDDAARDVLRTGDLAHLNLLMRQAGSGSGHSLDRVLFSLLEMRRVRFEDVFARAEEKAWILERMRGVAQ